MTGASGRFELTIRYYLVDGDLSVNGFHKMWLENCGGMDVGTESHRTMRQARRPSRRKTIFVPPC